MPILITELKSQPQSVKSNRELAVLEVKNDRFKATYVLNRTLEDGSALPDNNFTVERAFADAGSAMDLLNQLVQMVEQWRLEDDAARAKDKSDADAEAIRWAALTPEEQKAEVEAARAAAEAAAVPIDPNPSGIKNP